MFERDLNERIAIRAKTSSGLPFGLLVYGRDVEDVLIIFDEALQQARQLRSVRGVVDIGNPSGQSEDLALAEKLFVEALLEFKSLAGEGTSDFALLNALGVLEFLFAEIQDLAMVEPQRRDADKQQGAEHNPEDAQSPSRELLEGLNGHRNFPKQNASEEKRSAQRDESTGVSR